LSRADGNNLLQLDATSIHGEGDKIALPQSILEYLTNSGNDLASGSPWIFRIGILNPEYSFPASPLLQSMQPPAEDEDMEDDDDDDDEEDAKKAYLDELSHRYLSYTHGTVVEFTQDEGHIGLPGPIAAALLRPSSDTNTTTTIPVTRTVDPAKKVDNLEDAGDNSSMDVDDEKTPGHLAYGAFDLPDLPIEVLLVQIPKGKACKLVPTPEAVSKGFYNLKDVKLMLEQSLIRTRATLSVGDVVHSWHRGAKFDLKVAEVTPSTYSSVTCINTDIEVEFGMTEMPNAPGKDGTAAQPKKPTGYTLGSGSAPSTDAATTGTGFTLGSTTSTPPTTTSTSPTAPDSRVELLKEPPAAQTEGVCTVQIRADGGNGRRRFDIQQATLGDLFAFATTISGVASECANFQLVTRFPRRAFRLDNGSSSSTLQQVGLQSGQELFLVENLS
jgi:hypothetical protein